MSGSIPLPRPGQGADKARMDEILRVDHAGEYAAVLIYRAQKAVFEGRKGRDGIARDLSEMQDQEAVHLDALRAAAERAAGAAHGHDAPVAHRRLGPGRRHGPDG